MHWPRRALGLIAFAAFFFAADLAAWHVGIHMTKLGNATLFGNVSSFAFAAWGLWLVRRWPSPMQGAALVLAALGGALLMGSSAELGLPFARRPSRADRRPALRRLSDRGGARPRKLPPFPLLFLASVFGAAMLLPFALGLGDRCRRGLDLRAAARARQPGASGRGCSSMPSARSRRWSSDWRY